MSVIKVNNITNRDGSTGTTVAGIPVVDSTSHFVVPSGDTAERGSRGRGVFAGGNIPGAVTNAVEYITIATQGNAKDFGDLSRAARDLGALASSTRGITAGGATPGDDQTNTMDYTTIQSTGNSFDFGDLTYDTRGNRGLSNNTRGLFFSGHDDTPAATRVYFANINYLTIASLGNASEFGELDQKLYRVAGLASPTRGVMSGGSTPTPTSVDINRIQYVTISTLGNTQDFGDLTEASSGSIGASNTTRGVFGGGGTPTAQNTISYITIASTGDAIDFGDLTQARFSLGSAASQIRGVFGGGDGTTQYNIIDYVTIATTGDAADFGDLITGINQQLTGCSDSHGGLG